ncbi:hypothetical protein [Rhizobium sp. Nf11,1]|uniref:hypothetical protein n=1 Tax=Rhizobium sp. Nf11,1 TaxID=3404923 RepID=UPI003D33FEC7
MKVEFHKSGPDAPSRYHFKVTASRVMPSLPIQSDTDTIVVLLDDSKRPYSERELEIITRIITALSISGATPHDR